MRVCALLLWPTCWTQPYAAGPALTVKSFSQVLTELKTAAPGTTAAGCLFKVHFTSYETAQKLPKRVAPLLRQLTWHVQGYIAAALQGMTSRCHADEHSSQKRGHIDTWWLGFPVPDKARPGLKTCHDLCSVLSSGCH